MRRIVLILGFALSACAQSEPPTEPAPGHFEMGPCSQMEARAADSEAADSEAAETIAVVALCVETEEDPLEPVFYVPSDQCAHMEVTVGEHIDTVEVLVSGPEDSPRLTIWHARDGEAVSDHAMLVEPGIPTRIGKDGPVAQLDFVDLQGLRAWREAGGADVVGENGCV